jgi:hypothetical protein
MKFSRACFLRLRPATFTVAMLVAYWGGAVGAPLRAAGGGVYGRPCSERTSRGALFKCEINSLSCVVNARSGVQNFGRGEFDQLVDFGALKGEQVIQDFTAGFIIRP